MLRVATCAAAVASASGLYRGVAPEEQAKYPTVDGSFTCGNGPDAQVLPASALNDEYCDCLDGSDEPGTGACSGQDSTLFHCINKGSTPMLIYSSRVDDGICDCCDGSDEAGLAARRPSRACPNECLAQGAREREERATRVESLKQGLAKKKAIAEKALIDREAARKELENLRQAQVTLESELETAKKEKAAKDAEAAAREAAAAPAAGCEACEERAASLEKTVNQQAQEIARLNKVVENLMNGGDDHVDAVAKDTKKEEPKKAVVSEYAKWMDGAGDTPGAIDEEVHGDESEEGEDEGVDEDPASDTVEVAAEATPAVDLVKEAEDKVKKVKNEMAVHQKKLDAISDDRLGYASLEGRCIERRQDEYTYKVCFFDKANQDSVSLGKWSRWTGPNTAVFNGGTYCPGGPARDLSVTFVCGAEETIEDIYEPSRCQYAVTIKHPGACQESDFDLLANPKVLHPKDEL